MLKTNLLLPIIISLICIAQGSRQNLTDFYNKLLGRNNTIEAWSGYQDIDWYLNPDQASVYYSLWQCSIKKFNDHSVPLIFYLAGGRYGMASQFAAFREYGPYQILKKSAEEGGGYKATENPWAWNYFGHLVFVDQPIGTGFSYNNQKTVGSVTTAALHFTNFLYNFINKTPWGFRTNPIYLCGDGFSGQIISAIHSVISQNKTMGLKISGAIFSNSFISLQDQLNTYQSFLSSTGIFSTATCNKIQKSTNSAIQILKNSPQHGQTIRNIIQGIWNGDGLSNMDVYNYRYFGIDNQGTDYVQFLIDNKKNIGVPDSVTYTEYNDAIDHQFTSQMFVSYKEVLGDLINDEKIRVLIFNGQNNFKVNAVGVEEYLKNTYWRYSRQWHRTVKDQWKESGVLRGWVKKYQNLIFVILKDTGHYIYQDDTFGARSAWLMMSNYFNAKW